MAIAALIALSLLAPVTACDWYRKVSSPACADGCFESTVGHCPFSIIKRMAGLDDGKCADVNYTVPHGTTSQKAGPCGTLVFNEYTQPSVVETATTPTGSYCGSVPFILDNRIVINSATSADLDINIKIAHKEVKCTAEAIAVSGSTVSFPHTGTTGDCMGDALRSQGKDASKYYLDVNDDGTLAFHSDGYPTLKMKPCSSATVEEEVVQTEPCCQGACKTAGQAKYYSISRSLFGARHCGECCMDPKDYPTYHLFERNLTRATSSTPCAGFDFAKYDSTVTHGFGPIKMTLDLYDPSSA